MNIQKFHIVKILTTKSTVLNEITIYILYCFVHRPRMFIKLPANVTQFYSTKYPFNLQLFSAKALKCVMNSLPPEFERGEVKLA